MTLAEFKAWFEGFTEAMDGPPDAKAWKRIKARVAEIDGTAITKEVIYRDRYWPTLINRPVEPYISWGAVGGTGVGASCASTVAANAGLIDLGKAEYSAMHTS
ncbi:hypothetical protein [Mesorhizobium sp. BE184]|uniref:hypothetical protein n=1 Tax=Mesorhizobium sp. BE184 TaxID=2817714 RepID=UPI002855F36A|nr:hypothetical protein [Mesorhizobium sp. BE184]MDR7032421.1 hypothetical protein [Mesorhizobium sp. BE184]